MRCANRGSATYGSNAAGKSAPSASPTRDERAGGGAHRRRPRALAAASTPAATSAATPAARNARIGPATIIRPTDAAQPSAAPARSAA